MQMDKPRVNVSQAFGDNFKIIQERWLQSDDNFKAGILFYGQVAANQLKNMYYLCPASRVIAKDEMEKTSKHQDFINSLDDFRVKVFQYAKKKNKDLSPSVAFPLVPDYVELDNEYDGLVRQFYLMMYKAGFSA